MSDRPEIEAVAEAWASIDGRLEKFQMDKAGKLPETAGHYQGYICDAESLVERILLRGFVVVPIISRTESQK